MGFGALGPKTARLKPMGLGHVNPETLDLVGADSSNRSGMYLEKVAADLVFKEASTRNCKTICSIMDFWRSVW